jgi:acyl dehydratase
MPIDPNKALGYEVASTVSEYTEDQVILYHLGVGAGALPTEPGELEYTYEARLKVLPSFGVIPVLPMLGAVLGAPGLEFDWAMLLHGEQEIELHAPLPLRQKVQSSGRVAEIWDKGKAAVVVVEAVTTGENGEKLCTNRFTSFIRGEGGFGGETGPPASAVKLERMHDLLVESPTLPQQALLYRLSGDKNPLHADPEFAKLGGFDAPILHGLCSYGIACKAIVDRVLDGDVTNVARYQARFAGVVFPGETLVHSIWKERDAVLIETRTKERDTPVLTNGRMTLRT